MKTTMEPITYLWKDRRRRCGLPLSFTRYRLSEDRLFMEKGFFSLREEEVLLYRVRDLELTRNLWQRLFNMGTVCVHSSDKTNPQAYGGQGAHLSACGAGQGRAPHPFHGGAGRRRRRRGGRGSL